jgi:hypothetical protein
MALTIGGVEVLSGDEQSSGPIWSHTNLRNIIDANIDGWYEGQGTCITNVMANIDLSAADPLVNFAGVGSFKLGFTPAGKRPFAVVFEIVSNASGVAADGKGAAAVPLIIQDVTTSDILATLFTAGDTLMYLRQNHSTVAGAEFKAALNAGVLPVVFKLIALYRSAQYPV